MASLEQWIKDFPVITRTYMAGALLTTAACALDLLSPFSLYFSLPMIVHRHQYWRLVTNFFFFGQNFSLDFLFHMFFLVRYCRALEEGSFRGRTADFFFLILFGALLMTCVAPLVSLHFLGSSLTFMMVYVWARRNPFARMNFLGLFTFTAPYLPSAAQPEHSRRQREQSSTDAPPVVSSSGVLCGVFAVVWCSWVLLSFSFLLGNNGMVDVLGICVGHLYYFLEDVYPLMLPSRKRLLQTPHLLTLLFQPTDDGTAAMPAAPTAAAAAQQQQQQQPAAAAEGADGLPAAAAAAGDADDADGAEQQHPPLVAAEELLAQRLVERAAAVQAVEAGEAAHRRRQQADRLLD